MCRRMKNETLSRGSRIHGRLPRKLRDGELSSALAELVEEALLNLVTVLLPQHRLVEPLTQLIR